MLSRRSSQAPAADAGPADLRAGFQPAVQAAMPRAVPSRLMQTHRATDRERERAEPDQGKTVPIARPATSGVPPPVGAIEAGHRARPPTLSARADRVAPTLRWP